jgi:hypothetical protein
MTINIELEQVTCSGISLNQFLILKFLEDDNRIGLMDYINKFRDIGRADIDNLISNGYITTTDNPDNKYLLINLKLTDKFSTFAPLKIEEWIDEWYSLWPQGVKSGGYYVKSDKSGCKNKLQKFLKNNSTITKDIIIQATKNYITEQENSGYKYMRMAPYFVEKNGLSVLSGYCEAIMENYVQDTGESKFIEEA